MRACVSVLGACLLAACSQPPAPKASSQPPRFESALVQGVPYHSLGPIRFDGVRLNADFTGYLYAYSDCHLGVGIKVSCDSGSHLSAELLDPAGKPLSLKDAGARNRRTPHSVDLWSPEACHDFFVKITNNGRDTICNLVLSALVLGP